MDRSLITFFLGGWDLLRQNIATERNAKLELQEVALEAILSTHELCFASA